MTRLSRPTLYQCPACAGYFTRAVLTFLHFHDDVPKWTDGMNGQWWAGIGAPVGRCPSCLRVVWIDDATKIMPAPSKPRPVGAVARLWHRLTGDRQGRLQGERNWLSLPREIKDAGPIKGLQGAQDFLDALAKLVPDDLDRETYVRRRLWWASNDHQRLSEHSNAVSAEHAMPLAKTQANMHRLLELIERDPKQQVERGELLRQLGKFDDAIAVLTAVLPNGHSEVHASKIERLARRRDNKLQILNDTVWWTRPLP